MNEVKKSKFDGIHLLANTHGLDQYSEINKIMLLLTVSIKLMRNYKVSQQQIDCKFERTLICDAAHSYIFI